MVSDFSNSDSDYKKMKKIIVFIENFKGDW